MSDRAALLRAVAARPGADLPRLVYADWLDDHGEPARASFIRHQVAAARLAPGSPARLMHLGAADGLEAAHDAGWLGEWRGRLVDWEFRRGFVRRARITLANWLAHGEALFDWEPVEELTIVTDADEGLSADEVRAAVGHPAFARVRGYVAAHHRHVAGQPDGPPDPWLRALAEARHVGRLSSLAVLGGIRPDADFIDFCAAPHLRSLRSLGLSHLGNTDGDGPTLGAALAGARFAPRLRRLALSGAFGRTDWCGAVAGGPFDALRSLRLWSPHSPPESRRLLYHSPSVAAVRAFDLPWPDSDYAASPLARRVDRLSVEVGGPEHSAPFCELVRTARPPSFLTIYCLDPPQTFTEPLAASDWLRRVRTLTIESDFLSNDAVRYPAEVRRLFAPGAMTRLADVTLSGFDATGVLDDWNGTARLESANTTSFGGDGPTGLALLAAAPRLRAGVVGNVRVCSDADLTRLAGLLGPAAIHLILTVAGDDRLREGPTAGGVEAFLATADLPRLRSLSVYGYPFSSRGVTAFARRLADPAVLPGLSSLDIRADDRLAAPLRRRFGPRLRLS